MRILFLSQGRKAEDHPDFDKALRCATCRGQPVELYNLPYVGFVEKNGGKAFYAEVLRLNAEFKPDLVFFQFFHSADPGDPRPCVKALKSASNHPIVVGSLGDPFNTGLLKILGRPMPRQLLQLAAVADAMFTTAMGRTAQELVRHGARNVVFLPHAFNIEHFPLTRPDEVVVKKYDVVMVGSCVGVFVKRILSGLTRGLLRQLTVWVMTRSFGDRFAVYGVGWRGMSAKGAVPYKEQLAVIKEGRVSIDVPAQISDRYYGSDRPFFIAGAGVPLVMKHVAGFEKILCADENVYFANSVFDMPRTCRRVLAVPKDVLEQRKIRTLRLIAERHLVKHRMDTVLSVYESLVAIRSGRMSVCEGLRHLRLWHFLEEIDLKEELKHAVVNWRG